MSAPAEDRQPRKSPAEPKAKLTAMQARAKVAPKKAASKAESHRVQSPEGRYLVVQTYQQMVNVLLPYTNTDDRMEVFKATKAGFSLSSVIDLIESVDAFKRFNVLSKIVGLSDRTLARRMKKKDESLTPEQSARALYYAEVLGKAQEVFGSRALAEEWMTKPALGLDGESPIDLLANPVGHELVTDFLHRLEYGVY